MCPDIHYPAPSPIKRKNIVIENGVPLKERIAPRQLDCKVLVINASSKMAKEMTHQITLAMPGCSIMYAPTLELARWILKRRDIDLVVSSALLPDGSIAKLSAMLASSESAPDLVVVGSMNKRLQLELKENYYQAKTARKLTTESAEGAPRIMRNKYQPQPPAKETKICELGADIRNDLNNPLQEIVAMVFVAQAAQDTGEPASDQQNGCAKPEDKTSEVRNP